MSAMGQVEIADTEYGEHLLTQLLQFPAGSKDDAVDMAALMGMAIDQAHPAILAKPAVPSIPVDRYAPKVEEPKTWRIA